MPVICLVRHGDYFQRKNTPSAHQPFPLTIVGEQQAEKAAFLLESFTHANDLNLSRTIYSSTLLRAWQTASIISKNMQAQLSHDGLSDKLSDRLSIESTMALAERGVGYAANMTVAEIEQVLAKDPRYEVPPNNWKSNSDYRLPFEGAESLMQAGLRVSDYLRHIANNLVATEMAIVVGHGAAFRHAAYHLGILSRDDITRLSMFHCEPVFLGTPEKLSDKWLHISGNWKIRQQSDQPD